MIVNKIIFDSKQGVGVLPMTFLDFDMPDVEPIEVEPQRCLCCERELSAEAYCQDCAGTVLDYHVIRLAILVDTVAALEEECRGLRHALESLKNGAE